MNFTNYRVNSVAELIPTYLSSWGDALHSKRPRPFVSVYNDRKYCQLRMLHMIVRRPKLLLNPYNGSGIGI